MATWFPFAVGASILYGLHQVFTKLAAGKIGDGLGGFVVEGVATVTICVYLAVLWFSGNWNQNFSKEGFLFSAVTGICVGIGTVLFFLLFEKGGPLSVVPAILAVGAALMAVVGMMFFKEPISAVKLLGVALSIAGLVLLKG